MLYFNILEEQPVQHLVREHPSLIRPSPALPLPNSLQDVVELSDLIFVRLILDILDKRFAIHAEIIPKILVSLGQLHPMKAQRDTHHSFAQCGLIFSSCPSKFLNFIHLSSTS